MIAEQGALACNGDTGDMDSAGLANSVSPVNGLLFYCGVPPLQPHSQASAIYCHTQQHKDTEQLSAGFAAYVSLCACSLAF